MEEISPNTKEGFVLNPFGYDEESYIERNYRLQTIRREIFNKESPPFILFITNATNNQLKSLGASSRKIHFVDIKEIAGSKEQWINIPHEKSRRETRELYERLCKRHEDGLTVHWIELCNGFLVWKKCNGVLGDLIKYLETKELFSSAISDFDLVSNRILIIADAIGMGKSTLLNKIARKLVKDDSSKRIFRFDLKSYANEDEENFSLKEIVFQEKEEEEQAIEFVSRMINFEDPLKKINFKHSCRDSKDIVLIFDGFDEVNKESQRKILSLLKALKNGSQVSMWITTRFDEKSALESSLDILSHCLEPLTSKQQTAFLDQLWKKKLRSLVDNGQSDPLKDISEFLKEVRVELEIFFESIENPKHRLQVLMLMNAVTQMISISIRAHIDGKDQSSSVLEKINELNFFVYAKILLKRMNVSNSKGEIAFSSIPFHILLMGNIIFDAKFKMLTDLNLYDLCEKFIEMKFCEYYKRKRRTPSVGNIYSSPEFFSCKQMSLEFLLPDETSSRSLSLTMSEKFDQELMEDIGLVVKTSRNHRFVHQIFEEYFFCEWVVSDLGNEEVQKVLIKKILDEPNYSTVRTFLDIQIGHKLIKINLTDTVIKETDFFGSNDFKGTFLHLLCEEGLGNILEVFSEAFPLQISDIVLKTNSKMQNFLHVACFHGWNNVIKVILNFAKAHLSKETVEKMALQKDDWGVTPFYGVGGKSFVELFVDFLFDNNNKMGEEVSSYLLEINLLCAENSFLSKTFLTRHADSFTKVLEVAFSKFSRYKYRELIVELTDMDGNTCLHNLAQVGRIDNLAQFWEYADKTLSLDSLDEHLQRRNGMGNTVLHQTALGSNIFSFHQLIKYAKQVATGSESVRQFLTMFNAKGSTVLHEAIKESKVEFLQQLCDVLDEELDRDTLTKFLTQLDSELNTVLHLAIQRDAIDIMRFICGYIQEILSKEVLKEFLLVRNGEAFSPFHSGAQKGSVNTLRILWECSEVLEKETTKKLITMTTENGDLVFHLAATRGKADILKVFSEYALGIITKDSLKSALIHGNNQGNTVLHLTSLNSLVDTCNYWFRFISFVLDKKNMKDAIMKLNEEGDSVLHLAVKQGKLAVILEICSHVKNLLQKDYANDFLLKTDRYENTILHLGVIRGDCDILRHLFGFVKGELDPGPLKEFIKRANEDGDTLFHLGVKIGQYGILKQVFDFIANNLDESAINCLLLKKNVQGKTTMQLAYEEGDFEGIKDFCYCAKATLVDDSLLELVKNINEFDESLLHLAVHLEKTSKMKRWCDFIKDLLSAHMIEKIFAISNQHGDTVLHYVLRLRDAEVIIYWFEFAIQILSKECLVEVFQKSNCSGYNIVHLFTSIADISITKKLCNYSREILGEDAMREVVLRCNNSGDAVLHSVIRKCELNMVKYWLDFFQDLGEDFLAKALVENNSHGDSILHLAVVRDDVEIVKMLCDCAKRVLTKETMECFLTSRIKNGANVLHFIARRSDVLLLNVFWDYCLDSLDKEILEGFLQQTNTSAETVLHLATIRGKLSMLNQILLYMGDFMSQKSLKTVMIQKNFEGNGVLHLATSKGRIDIFRRLWEWYNEFLSDDPTGEFLTNTNSHGDTVLHLAAKRSEIIFLSQLCEFCSEKLSQEPLRVLILMPNKEGLTCLHSAIIEGETAIVKILYNYAKSVLDEKELLSFFKKPNDEKDTVLHLSVREGKLSITMYLCEYAKDIMDLKSLRRFLTKPNCNGKTIVDEALLIGHNYYIEALWEYANQPTTAETRTDEYKIRKAARTIDCCATS